MRDVDAPGAGFGDLDLPPAEAATLRASLRPVTLPRGHVLFEPGMICQAYVLLRTGRARVHQLDPEGREVVLYRLGPGDTCILNATALLARQPYAAFAVAETPVEGWLLPAARFAELVAASAGFRAFVFRAHAERIGGLMRVIRDLAFERIDARLARCLLALADPAGVVRATHADLATELGTAREVISRQLKLFERTGWVRLGKAELAITDRSSLTAVARGE